LKTEHVENIFRSKRGVRNGGNYIIRNLIYTNHILLLRDANEEGYIN
jgi:hypothetical protein